ncbi:redoxin domain-containing protein [Aquimarina macrocephali]|uniref:redoxin domain-containing protein n=1 Tax=Aquimarina macrocephali TaxID=666563 RepID=UPI003F67C2AE
MNSNLHYIFTIVLTLTLLSSCKTKTKDQNPVEAETSSNEYTILGTIKNIPDSTWIYLSKSNKEKDSTLIINEKFQYSGNVEEPTSMFAYTKNPKEGFFQFYVENQEIKIEATKGDSKNAIISGGKTQKENEILTKRKDSLNKEFDKIQELYRTGKVAEKNRDSLQMHSKKIRNQIQEVEIQFIKDFPDSYVSGQILKIYNTTFEKNKVIKLYESLSDKIKTSKNGLAIKHFLSLPETPNIGDKYIDFELPDTKGKKVKLSDINGKYILIEFWASWCGPCIEENPKLVKTYNKYKNQNFEIIGVSLDINKKHWVKAIEKDKLPWVNISDLKGDKTDVSMIYGVNGIPSNFMIDEKGVIIAKNLRGLQLENKLKELFQ